MKKTKPIYLYDIGTGEFVGRGVAKLCPVKGDVYHYPAGSTETPPPAVPAGSVALFDGAAKKWNIIEDHRGKTKYSVETKEELGVVNFFDDLDETTTSLKPKEDDVWDGLKWVPDEALIARKLSEKPMREWKGEITATDSGINARVVEELFDALSDAIKAKIPQETKDKFAERKDIRKRRPA